MTARLAALALEVTLFFEEPILAEDEHDDAVAQANLFAAQSTLAQATATANAYGESYCLGSA